MWPAIAREQHLAEIEAMFARPDRWASFGAFAPQSQAVGLLEASLREFDAEAISEPIGYLETWFVIPAWRRRGVGQALVLAAEDWAWAHGCRRMGSDTELDNAASRAAHAHLGYREAGQFVRFSKPLA